MAKSKKPLDDFPILDLSSFPESKWKTELLELYKKAKKKFETRQIMSPNKLTELKEKLSLSTDEDRVKIIKKLIDQKICGLIDTTKISSELKEVLLPYKYLSTKIFQEIPKKNNK